MTGEEIRKKVQDIVGGEVKFIENELTWMFEFKGIQRGWFKDLLEPLDINSMQAMDEINTIAMNLLDPTNKTSNDKERKYYSK